jgi:hypothetical protein
LITPNTTLATNSRNMIWMMPPKKGNGMMKVGPKPQPPKKGMP